MKYLGVLVSAAVTTVFAASPATAATTIGNPAVPASQVDGCTACTFVVNQSFGVAGLRVGMYRFFANAANPITPLLLTRTDTGTVATFTVVGVGQQRNAVAGLNQFAFDVVQGTNLTAANTYFGFAYTTGASVAFEYFTPGSASGTFVGPSGYTGPFGSSFSDDTNSMPQNSYDALNARTYSINVSAVPEPAVWGMMIVGFGMVGAGLRRSRRQAVRVTYA